MYTRRKEIPPALKHGAYSATAILPGESRQDFEKLYQELVAELIPCGVLEEDIVMRMARLVWRKRNLQTIRTAEFASERYSEILSEKRDAAFPSQEKKYIRAKHKRLERAAEHKAQKELGEVYELIEIGNTASFNGLVEELDIEERLDASINKCLKQLLLVRGVKSVTASSSLVSPQLVPQPPKVA